MKRGDGLGFCINQEKCNSENLGLLGGIWRVPNTAPARKHGLAGRADRLQRASRRAIMPPKGGDLILARHSSCLMIR
jgi:hypothetical protein